MTEACCPVCGTALEPCRVMLDLSSNTIFYSGRSVRVHPKQAELLYLLIERWPDSVIRDEAIRRMYGLHEPGDAEGCFGVYVSKLRRKLETIGLTVPPMRGGRVRLHVPPAG